MANTFEGFLSIIRHSFFYPFDLIEFFWCLMKRAGLAFFKNLVYFSLLQSIITTAISF